MATIFLDIQTIPCQDQQLLKQLAASVKPPGHYSQPETIAKWYREHQQTEMAKKVSQTALDGLYGEVFSIAWAIDDGEIVVFWRDQAASERGLLENFMFELAELSDAKGKSIAIHRWVGHFISSFDLRFLWQRCVIHQLKPSVVLPIDAKLWDDRVFDTKMVWTGFGSQTGQGSLLALSTALGLPGALELAQKNVYLDWLAGRYQAIADFNRLSLSLARDCYRRMNFIDVSQSG